MSLLAVVLLTLNGVAIAGDPVAGKTYFGQVCTSCHTADPVEGGGEIGPTLVGVMGRTAGTGDKQFPYSQALKDSKLVWDAAALQRFLEDPAAVVPGTTMPMPIPDKKDRDNVIAYLESLLASAK